MGYRDQAKQLDDELQAAARAAVPPQARDQSGQSSPESYRAPESPPQHRHRKSDGHRDSKRQR